MKTIRTHAEAIIFGTLLFVLLAVAAPYLDQRAEQLQYRAASTASR